MVHSLLAVLALSSLSSPTRYVDPMIGTGGTGHTFPGPVLPHGMVQLSPDTGTEGWEHCSGYYYSDRSIMGFSHLHLSGTGASDQGDILVTPTVGEQKLVPGDIGKLGSGYRSRFSHSREAARAGYYSVFLETPKVQAELTATSRVGIHRYTFPRTDKANLNFDITHHIHGQTVTLASARWISPTELEGSVFTNGWARDQRTYFVARFSQPATRYGVAVDNTMEAGKTQAEGKFQDMDAYATFDTRQNPTVMVKVALSAVGTDGARLNLNAEATHWDFERYARAANAAWSKTLSVAKVKGGTDAQKRIYYTAWYHASIHPSLYQDVDGRYLGMDRKIYQSAKGATYYHIYSLWDTYRAEHPLFQLTQPSLNAQFVNAMLDRYKIRGELPVWELDSSENYCMIGTPAVPVVANAIINGAPGIDRALALKAVDDSLKYDARGQKLFLDYGFVPSNREGESVSKTLEFSYANGAASEMARFLGKTDDANLFWKRSQGYRMVFDPAQGLASPKTDDGKWVPDYKPASLQYSPRFVTEGNSWQYSWLVMHDLPGMISLYPSRQAFLDKLAQTFDPANKPIGAQSDVSGTIGQYAHGNEPSHHVAYLFALAGRPDLTQKYVQQICRDFYRDKPSGIIGNDDAGQMSAWYIFSAMGFYPVDPASGEYALGVPQFRELKLKLENGKTIRVVAKGFDPATGTVRQIRWNNRVLDNSRIRHADLIQGGTLEFIGVPSTKTVKPKPKPLTFPVRIAAVDGVNGFTTDMFGSEAQTNSTTSAVDTKVPNAGPEALYQSEHYGSDFSYSVPAPKGTYRVRLHFAEVFDDVAGQRLENISINGRRVLTGFDIAAIAGQNKAVVREFTGIQPNAQGKIVIRIEAAEDSPDQNAKISGLEIFRDDK